MLCHHIGRRPRRVGLVAAAVVTVTGQTRRGTRTRAILASRSFCATHLYLFGAYASQRVNRPGTAHRSISIPLPAWLVGRHTVTCPTCHRPASRCGPPSARVARTCSPEPWGRLRDAPRQRGGSLGCPPRSMWVQKPRSWAGAARFPPFPADLRRHLRHPHTSLGRHLFIQDPREEAARAALAWRRHGWRCWLC